MSYLILYNCLRLSSYEKCNEILNLIKHFYMTNLFDITNYMIIVRKSLNLNICLQEKFLIKNLFNVNNGGVLTSIELLAKQFDAYFRDIEVNACLIAAASQFDFNLQLNNDNLVDHNDRNVLQFWLSDTQTELNVDYDYRKLLDEQIALL